MESTKDYYTRFFFDVSLCGGGKGVFGYNIGYNYPIEIGIFDLLLRPFIGISLGESSIEFVSEQIDTFGIMIKDTDYIDTDLD